MPWDHHAVGSPCCGITYCKWAWPETKLSQNTALLLCCVSPHSRAPTHPTPRSELCKVSLQVGQLSLLPAATLRACRTRGTRARAPPAEASPPPPPPTYLPSMPCRHLTRGPTYLPPRLIAQVDLPSMNKHETQRLFLYTPLARGHPRGEKKGRGHNQPGAIAPAALESIPSMRPQHLSELSWHPRRIAGPPCHMPHLLADVCSVSADRPGQNMRCVMLS